MRRKPAPVRDHEPPLPPMLAGDGGAALPASAPADIVSPGERAAAALLPDDLCVTIEGTSAGGLLAIAASLPLAMTLGMYGMHWINPDAPTGARVTDFLFVGAGVSVLGWLLNRDVVRRHRTFRLGEDGITVEVTPLVGARRGSRASRGRRSRTTR